MAGLASKGSRHRLDGLRDASRFWRAGRQEGAKQMGSASTEDGGSAETTPDQRPVHS